MAKSAVWVAWRALLQGLSDVFQRLEGRGFGSRAKGAESTAWLDMHSMEQGRPGVLDGRGFEWGAKTAIPKAWLVTRFTERGRPVVLEGRTYSGEREGTEGVLNEVCFLGPLGLRLGAPAEALVPLVGLLYKALDVHRCVRNITVKPLS